ncbi:MAG TPA: UDP-2,3-diacylglucosamine diphosphatase [Cytophagales bacterium]|nr:UDP-2,3-diacylglucosamine diphosphatase [Cytophagales bacterium]
MKFHYKTIVVSDVHLGSSGSKAKELVRFLKLNTADTLILNGDIIDGWQLKKSGVWKRKHTRFLKIILNMIEKYNTKVIYTRGNHDDFLDQILPFEVGNFSIVKDYYYESFGKKYYVVHGDIFDSITSKMKWLAKLGDVGYTLLLWINKKYNNYRLVRGLPYYSLSKVVKAKVKSAVNFICEYETKLSQLAKEKGCYGVICGHIHCPEIREVDGIKYLNSGDWVESLSALVEDFNGDWSLIYYNEVESDKDITKVHSNLLRDEEKMQEVIMQALTTTAS